MVSTLVLEVKVEVKALANLVIKVALLVPAKQNVTPAMMGTTSLLNKMFVGVPMVDLSTEKVIVFPAAKKHTLMVTAAENAVSTVKPAMILPERAPSVQKTEPMTQHTTNVGVWCPM